MFPFAVEPSSRTACDRSGFKLTASRALGEAAADSTPKVLSARAALTTSAIITLRQPRKANRAPPEIMSIVPRVKKLLSAVCFGISTRPYHCRGVSG
jgi:hypothetical protein